MAYQDYIDDLLSGVRMNEEELRALLGFMKDKKLTSSMVQEMAKFSLDKRPEGDQLNSLQEKVVQLENQKRKLQNVNKRMQDQAIKLRTGKLSSVEDGRVQGLLEDNAELIELNKKLQEDIDQLKEKGSQQPAVSTPSGKEKSLQIENQKLKQDIESLKRSTSSGNEKSLQIENQKLKQDIESLKRSTPSGNEKSLQIENQKLKQDIESLKKSTTPSTGGAVSASEEKRKLASYKRSIVLLASELDDAMNNFPEITTILSLIRNSVYETLNDTDVTLFDKTISDKLKKISDTFIQSKGAGVGAKDTVTEKDVGDSISPEMPKKGLTSIPVTRQVNRSTSPSQSSERDEKSVKEEEMEAEIIAYKRRGQALEDRIKQLEETQKSLVESDRRTTSGAASKRKESELSELERREKELEAREKRLREKEERNKSSSSEGSTLVRPSQMKGRVKSAPVKSKAKESLETIEEELPRSKRKEKAESQSSDTSAVTPDTREKIELVINFLDQAVSDSTFRGIIETLLDLDGLYMAIGGKALSIIYTYKTKGLDAKGDLLEHLNSWLVEGVPT